MIFDCFLLKKTTEKVIPGWVCVTRYIKHPISSCSDLVVCFKCSTIYFFVVLYNNNTIYHYILIEILLLLALLYTFFLFFYRAILFLQNQWVSHHRLVFLLLLQQRYRTRKESVILNMLPSLILFCNQHFWLTYAAH